MVFVAVVDRFHIYKTKSPGFRRGLEITICDLRNRCRRLNHPSRRRSLNRLHQNRSRNSELRSWVFLVLGQGRSWCPAVLLAALPTKNPARLAGALVSGQVCRTALVRRRTAQRTLET